VNYSISTYIAFGYNVLRCAVVSGPNALFLDPFRKVSVRPLVLKADEIGRLQGFKALVSHELLFVDPSCCGVVTRLWADFRGGQQGTRRVFASAASTSNEEHLRRKSAFGSRMYVA
jgi:hypothetical protein